jgi:hypothetical protein
MSQIHARHKPAVSVAATSIVIGLVATHDAVWPANGKSASIAVMSDVIVNDSVCRPYFQTINGPPSAFLRSIVTGAPIATDIAADS